MTGNFVPSLGNWHLPALASSNTCINVDCVLSHTLANCDPNNFGLHYAGQKVIPTNIFPRICRNCLSAKFGLFEVIQNENMSLVNCIVKKAQGADPEMRAEGPFLKAYKNSPSIVDKQLVVFLEGTLIIPSGQILMDILMAGREKLHNVNNKIPKIICSFEDDRSKMTMILNPYLYSYFKHMHVLQTTPSKTQSRKFTRFEDLLIPDQSLNPFQCLQSSYEVDTFVISNLLNPLAANSTFVKEGKILRFENNDKEITIKISDKSLLLLQHQPRNVDVIVTFIKDDEATPDDIAADTEIGNKMLGIQQQQPVQQVLIPAQQVAQAMQQVVQQVIPPVIQPVAQQVAIDDVMAVSIAAAMFKSRRELTSNPNNLVTTIDNSSNSFLPSHTDVNGIRGVNQYLMRQILSMRQLIMNRKPGLAIYFKHCSNIMSAVSLHIASFCFPNKILSDGNSFKEYKPNVKIVEGVGLLAIADICHNDLLILEAPVDLEDFVRLKMATYEDSVQYVQLNVDRSNDSENLAFEMETKQPKAPRHCLYRYW